MLVSYYVGCKSIGYHLAGYIVRVYKCLEGYTKPCTASVGYVDYMSNLNDILPLVGRDRESGDVLDWGNLWLEWM